MSRASGTAARYPFSAVVGMDDLKLALLINAVSPGAGGVLVRGEKGTAKSTIVRALADLLPSVPVVAGCRFSCDPGDPYPGCPDGPHRAASGDGTDGDPDGDAGPEPPSAVEERPARLVELPVGASEDRLTGSLDIERALTEGVKAYEPGLLAAAHRGVLYVDEVNLLHDHLVDLLLDAAAMGESHVEREGVSIRHAARFLLVGTMNPEEGELRPQLLDRFGLTVEVAATRDPAQRAEVVRRRLEFEEDPVRFAARWALAEAELAARIAAAQTRLPRVELTDAALGQITAVCAAFEVDGLRADLVTARAALALAAWHRRTVVTAEDVRTAARLALPHRRRRDPFDAPGLDEDRLDEILDQYADAGSGSGSGSGSGTGQARQDGEPDAPATADGDADGEGDDRPGEEGPGDDGPEDDGPDGPGDGPGGPDGPGGGDVLSVLDALLNGRSVGEGERPADDRRQAPSTGDDGDGDGPGRDRPAEGEPSPADAAFRPRLFTVPGTGAGAPGRRSKARSPYGRVSGARPGSRGLHLNATLRAAAPHQHVRGRTGPGIVVAPEDLREATRDGREGNLVLFVVDASGSMAARRRMRAVKGAVLSLLLDAYQRRDKVGLITFRGTGAELALPPTSSVEAGARRLERLPTGGRTPLAAGLLRAAETLRVERLRDPSRRPLLVVVTDGRATHGPGPRDAARALAGVASVVVDCESGPVRLGLAAELGGLLGAETVRLEELGADDLAGVVRSSRKVA
ncbi:VWA domain-containing protein [Actinomadura viridis]|uniref:VWA domain-containing protein n=1 Tax=Actinomadura viridis TaxID=58110 RepID=UPI003684AD6A